MVLIGLVAKVAVKKFKDYIDIKVVLPFDEETYKNTFGVEGISTKEESISEYEFLKSKIVNNKNDFIKLDFDKNYYNNFDDEKEKKAIRNKQYFYGRRVYIYSFSYFSSFRKSKISW